MSKRKKALPNFGSDQPRIAIFASDYHPELSDDLVKDASKILSDSKIKHDTIIVPGVLELAPALKMIINSKRYDGYIVLGTLLDETGDTTMYADALRSVSEIANQGYAVGSAILFANNEKTLKDRVKDDCGANAARAALELISISRNVSGERRGIGFKPASEFIQMAGEAPKTT